ncbi:hypothetical protein ABRT01_03270 [Lentibacillus sp. L22]|uniref:hypothetical protein n=1 Tax=Lentibacillus TaxID=175304 RepID=UPI0022B142CE|nr:hypothetical protein [Lentibacillus daqui]
MRAYQPEKAGYQPGAREYQPKWLEYQPSSTACVIDTAISADYTAICDHDTVIFTH